MNFAINITGIDEAIKQLEEYSDKLQRQQNELCRRLAEMGATNVSLMFARAIYTGDNDFSVSVDAVNNGYQIIVSGKDVAFVEFGAGITYGFGHPQAAEFGAGPGTYPGKGHWDDPKGWYTPDGEHTFGNPPNMPMYNTVQDLKREIARVAREVFA